MSTLAQTAELAWGYTMADVELLTTKACWTLKGRRLDQLERWEAAWFAIVEMLYTAEERPEPGQLYIAGVDGIGRAANQYNQAHGLTHYTGMNDVGPNYEKYWKPVSGPRPDFTENLVELMSLPQVLAALTGEEYAAVAAVAACGTQAAAAETLGITRRTVTKRIGIARRKILALWFEGETPHIGEPTETHCKNGHAWAEHGFQDGRGRMVCRPCRTNNQRRHRARGGERRVA